MSSACKRICTICGKEFDAPSSQSKFCSEDCRYKYEYSASCVICGSPCKIGKKTCSKECLKILNHRNIATSREKAKETCLKKYGCENPMQNKEINNKALATRSALYDGNYSEVWKEKFTHTMLEKYGVEHALNNSEILAKQQKTIEENGISYRFHTPEWDALMLERYGTTVPYKNTDIKNKGINTLLERYGVTSPAKLDFVKEKCKNTCLERYGVEYSFQSENNKQKSKQTLLDRYGVENAFFIHRRISNINKEIGELLEVDSYEFPIHLKQYDLKLNNTLIEINPTVSHNSDVDFCYGKRDPNYHFEKTKYAKENGYNCFNIWDWDDLEKVKFIFNKCKTRIGARKCDVVFIDKASADEFLNNYHIQNTCQGDRIRIGLTYNNILVGVMTFGAPRYTSKYEVELLRLCYHPDFIIIGGSEKMFQFFIDNYHPNSIISYCDNSKFKGNVYTRLGFKLKSYGTPSAHWFNNKTKKHITDNLLRQRGFDQLFGTNYGKGTSNEELMLQNGFVRVYDCGQSTYEYIN